MRNAPGRQAAAAVAALPGIGTEAYSCAPNIVVARVSPTRGFVVNLETSASPSSTLPDAPARVARLVTPRILTQS